MPSTPAHQDSARSDTAYDPVVFASVARVLLHEHTVQPTLDRICELAVETIHRCEHAGITVITGGRASTAAANDAVPAAIDMLQQEAKEGPCMDAIREQEVVRVSDLARGSRWPTFQELVCTQTPIRSMACFRLFTEQDTIGALNLYAARRDAFSDDDIEAGTTFAAHAAISLRAARQTELTDNLRLGMESHGEIGQAIGILMAQGGLTPEQAFEALRRNSQHRNIKLRELAARLVSSQTAFARQPRK